MQIISSKEEGLSLALIEGIFYAKVLIATDIANHKQILGSDLVFNNTEEDLLKQLNKVYKDYDRFKELFSKIKDTKDNYMIEKVNKKYVEAYKTLL